jgi:CDP-6-deoxy-D-xylo-4-hexulose-3-dehydrase
MPERADELRAQILSLVKDYHAAAFSPKEFTPGESAVQVAGRVFDAADIQHLVDASLDFWLTTGRFAKEFEERFAKLFGVESALLVNSGSSANLVALSCLTSPRLDKQPLGRSHLTGAPGLTALKPGDEVITVAAGFPTTVNPIIQNRLIPVFVDVDVPTYNIDVTQLDEALSPKTRAIMIAHTLGNPFDLKTVTAFAKAHNLWLVEDCCDAVGATYEGKSVGSFGQVATVSFYPAHHITMGEGGAVLVDSPHLKKLAESFRDWGRDCYCEPGMDNTCNKRFGWKLGDLPRGYDHKYTYSHIGYNLKVTDMQAAVGVSQLDKLPAFVAARRRNFQLLTEELSDLEEFFILPEATPNSQPSWFGYPLAVRPDAPFSREEVTQRLESRRIGTRLLFGGNLLRQPAYKDVPYRRVERLDNSDFVMNNVFWIGLFPGLTGEMLCYMTEVLHEFCREKRYGARYLARSA